MNPIYKLYCRTFQKVFHLAIPILPYRNPKILRSVSEVPSQLREKQVKSVLIVTDKVLHSLGMIDGLKEQLKKNGVSYHIYDSTVPNPTVDNVEQARALYLENGCQALIGFGGGSAIDCAKAVGARIARPNKPIAKMGGILKVMHKIPLLIAIPTTAGTGSEVTVATVITDAKTGRKSPISDFPLIPRVAVLDAENTKTMPLSMTSTTGMDALTHAVEAYIGRSTTRSTRKDATDAVRLIFENLEKAYQDGQNTLARANMMQASFLAGRAFSKSYVGYVHAVAHSLGGQYNIPHGLANAVLLPIVLEAYGKSAHKKLHELAIVVGLATKQDSAEDGAARFIAAVRNMNARMNIPKTLSGIMKEDIPKMAKHAAKEANPLYPVPMLMDAKALEPFYEKVADWSNT
ncbi:MAG: iron-containing alcohol dehydrogenase [Clostridia bacterium]|nr:iron-containing alcohol dehydrogenase [Clostridia bacterium]